MSPQLFQGLPVRSHCSILHKNENAYCFNTVVTYSIMHEPRFFSIWLLQFQSDSERTHLLDYLVPGDYIRGEKLTSHTRVSALKRVQYIGRVWAMAVFNNSSKDALSHIPQEYKISSD